MQRATHTPNTGNGSRSHLDALRPPTLCSILRFQLAFGHAGVHALDVMKTRLLMIAALGLLLAACNRQAPPAAPKTDLDRFQGTWYLVMAMQDGKALPDDKVKETTI